MISPLYPVLDSSVLSSDRDERAEYLTATVKKLIEAGVTILQYRNKVGSDKEILSDARVMRNAARSKLKLIMNDRPDLAVKVKFSGAHIGQGDLSYAQAREILSPEMILGISTHNEQQVIDADATLADYVAIGPIFATKTKDNPDPVVGLDGLRAARGLTKKPLVAIGGITLENVQEVWRAGADSVAVISAIFGTPVAPAKLAKDFLRLFR